MFRRETDLRMQNAHRFFRSTDGSPLWYSTRGSGEPPVLLLPGGPGLSVEYLDPVADIVAERARAVLLEPRGTGRSALGGDAELTISQSIRDLDALRQHLVSPRVALLGHSWGAMLAMAYAAAHPTIVSKLILIAPGGPTLAFVAPFEARIQARLTNGDRNDLTRSATGAHDARGAAVEAARVRTRAYFHDRSHAMSLIDWMTAETYSPEVNERLFADAAANYDIVAALAHVGAAVEIIQGRDDVVMAVDEIKQLLPQTRVSWLDHAGHYPWLEQRAAFRTALNEALTV